MTNSDDTNILRILQEQDGLTYSEAAELNKKKIRQKELDFIPAGVAVLDDPQLGQDPEVRRWIACLPYCMSGNLAWSQEVCGLLFITTLLINSPREERQIQCGPFSGWHRFSMHSVSP
jgi:hypothetical protein